MQLPSVIGPVLSTGHQLNGIISVLRDKYNIYDPISENIIIPYSNANMYNTANNTVLWRNYWCSAFGNESYTVYMQFAFPNRYFFPTGYSFMKTNENIFFQTE